ncbi:MAG: hypothetical protein ACHQRM_00110 [Bacteroidia bacterium]
MLFLFVLSVPGLNLAQGQNSLRSKKTLLHSDTLKLDTLSLVPGACRLLSKGAALDTSAYTINYSESLIYFKKRPEDSLTVSYKVFPYLFSEPRRHKDPNLLLPDKKGFINPFIYRATAASSDIFSMTGLTKSGSISRGLSFGNNQDLALNSSLNLQLAGKLSNDVDILLAASDQNIPIQPQGNTQNLQEFDKVFIQLSNKNSKLVAGDFVVGKPSGYFLNYNKKVQGLGFSTLIGLATDTKDTLGQAHMRVSASVAISKGKFGRMQLEGVEGNQGPYTLRGNENEPFIIILSGSEKVFIDGQLMKRGQEYDYVIDYNTSQVVFTSRNLITKDKRIIVEYQYSDKNYSRSLLNFTDEYTRKNMKLYFHAYSEQDNKNQPVQQSLSDPEKKLLHNIGDTLSKAIYPAVDSVAWSNSLVLYRKPIGGDTVVSGIHYTTGVYIYSNDPAVSHFQLSFSNVGAGNGDYINIPSSANGRVFQWVAPVSGVHQGSYAPVIQLVTPKKKQMITGGGEFILSKHTTLGVEGALSNYDQNTFSPYDDQNNTGYAFRFNLNNKTYSGTLPPDTTGKPALKKPSRQDSLDHARVLNAAHLREIPGIPDPAMTSKWIFSKTLNYEYVQQNFTPIERYRSTEFERDWNTGTLPFVSDQHYTTAGFALTRNRYGSLGYTLSSFMEGSEYNGLKNDMNGTFARAGYMLKANVSLLNTGGTQSNSQFLRHKAELSKKIRRITIGVTEQQEVNRMRAPGADSLLPTSFSFFEWQAYVQSADTARNKYRLSYKHRQDFTAFQNHFNPLSDAQDLGFSLAVLKNKNNDLKTTVTYRQLEVLSTSLTSQKPENSLVGRIEYNLRLWQGLLTSNTFYEAGSGLEQKKEYSYVLVPAGQGQYTWIDYNGDGIKQLNEFEIALYPDQATYIRVFTPTDQYIKAYTNQFSQNLLLKPGARWTNKKGIKKGLSHFADQATYRVDRKTTSVDPVNAYNPFLKSILDTSLVTLNSSFRNTLFFNQNDPVFGIDLNFQDVRGKSLLTNGFETRLNDFYELRIRWNMNKTLGLIVTGKDGTKSNASQFFANRDYTLAYRGADPKLTYQPNNRFRLAFDYAYTEKKNNVDQGGETVFSSNLGAETKYNIVNKGSLTAKLNYIDLHYNGSPNSAVAYEMLDGLHPGKNVTWSVGYQRTLSNNIQVNITYEGRQSENIKTIHTGGATVRAFF